MTSFIQTMFVPQSPSLPSFSPFSKPLAPAQSLEQSTSCIHLDLSNFGGPPKRKRVPSDASLVEALRDALLNNLTPHNNRAAQVVGGNLPGNWHADLEHCPRPPPKSPLRSPHRWSHLPPRHASGSSDANDPTDHEIRSLQDWLMEYSNSNSRARGPFRPQKTAKGTGSWQLRQFAEATLGSGSLRKAVKLPEGEDANEWFAVNIVDFFNQINLLYGSITEFCSPQTCPEMKATDEFEYLWQDSENFKRPTKMSAPEYIEHLMSWCQANIDNEQLFPSRIGVSFPKTFPSLLRQMFKRLYRVYAHIYCHHYPVVIQLGLEPHLNTSFKHYVLFIDEHQLASGKDFWGPLGDLVESMLKSD